jgi:hypothetical protein
MFVAQDVTIIPGNYPAQSAGPKHAYNS